MLRFSGWRASNLFASDFHARHAWSATVQLDEIHNGSYLAIPVYGPHVPEAVYAAVRCDGSFKGAAGRAAAYPANSWECSVCGGKNYTYFVPLDKSLEGKTAEVYLLGLETCVYEDIRSEVFMCCYPAPYVSKTLVLGGKYDVLSRLYHAVCIRR